MNDFKIIYDVLVFSASVFFVSSRDLLVPGLYIDCLQMWLLLEIFLLNELFSWWSILYIIRVMLTTII